jgi:hypothetical protein
MTSTNGIFESSNQPFVTENETPKQTERRMMKYGQVEVSRPCCKISASVQMPGANSFSYGTSFMFFQFILE